ncbi:MAG: hypothetical protein R6X02_29265 [Enhygromyxa sp.]
MTEAPPFLLDLRSTNGAPVANLDGAAEGEGDELTLYEWFTWLRIRSDVTGFVAPAVNDDDEFTGFVPPVFEDDGIAALIHARDHQDLGGCAVGLHHARLELADLEALREAVAQIDWPGLPRPVGGDFNAPTFALRYASGKLLINRAFNARSGNFKEAIAPLWRLLDKLMIRAKRGPSGTIEPILRVTPVEEDPRRFSIRVGLANRSIGPVALNDPRLPSSGERRLLVEIGERFSDYDSPPAEWTPVELPPLPEGSPPSLLLAPRKRWELELPWTAPHPGSYEVQMRWLDYGGPVEPLPGQVPFMPVPSTGRSFVGSGPYPVRGSCRAARRFDVGE